MQLRQKNFGSNGENIATRLREFVVPVANLCHCLHGDRRQEKAHRAEGNCAVERTLLSFQQQVLHAYVEFSFAACSRLS
jgi:hypothetical protein